MLFRKMLDFSAALDGMALGHWAENSLFA